MNLKQGVTLVVSQRVATFLGFLLLNICVERDRLTQVHLAIEAACHQAIHLVLSLTHHVRNTLGLLNV